MKERNEKYSRFQYGIAEKFFFGKANRPEWTIILFCRIYRLRNFLFIYFRGEPNRDNHQLSSPKRSVVVDRLDTILHFSSTLKGIIVLVYTTQLNS